MANSAIERQIKVLISSRAAVQAEFDSKGNQLSPAYDLSNMIGRGMRSGTRRQD
jgi:hypothetical protein